MSILAVAERFISFYRWASNVFILLPWFNLGCLGLRIGPKDCPRFYGDLFIRRNWGGPVTLRMFATDFWVCRRWYTLTMRGWRLDKVEPIHGESFCRVARRTLKPYDIATSALGRRWILSCYPYVNDSGVPAVMAHDADDELSELRELRCDQLRPLQLGGLTGIPACDPVPCKPCPACRKVLTADGRVCSTCHEFNRHAFLTWRR